jgi:hypothetical protein
MQLDQIFGLAARNTGCRRSTRPSRHRGW